MGFAERQDQFSKASGFQVEITGAAGATSTDGSWKVCRGGGLRFNENAGTTAGHDKYMQHSLGQKEWDDIVLIGPVTKSRKDMLKWYLDTVGGEDHRRNVSIIIMGPDGKESHRYNYIDCFLTMYKLTDLDAESEKECDEEIHICVGHSDNYLK